MKVGILTFHMAHNCGAMLQAYALNKYIEQRYHCNCEIIDYRLPEIYDKYEKMLSENNIESKRIKFEGFINNHLSMSKRIFNVKNAEKYDLYIIGSDQIWNPQITNGYKDVYFGKSFPSDSIRISYAASSGIHTEDIVNLAQKVRNFDFISVREKWLKEELSNFSDEKIYLCLDPVFLLDKIEWDNAIDNLPVLNHKKYILIYSFHMHKKDYCNIKSFALKNNLKIIELTTHNREKFSELIYENNYGPLEWVNFIKNAEYIFTDSYHCVLFSIIYNKQFKCINKVENNLRISDILQRLHIIKNNDGFYIASNKTNRIIDIERYNSNTYLDIALEKARNGKTDF